jgi:carbonic anhydrase
MPSLEGIDRDMTNIFKANRRWKAEKEAEDPEFFTKLGSGHSPTYMWIGMNPR